MANIFDEVRKALVQARAANRAADSNSTHMAEMLIGRLRHVEPYYLKKLKKELTQFNSARYEWKQ